MFVNFNVKLKVYLYTFMEVIQFSGFVVSACNSKSKKEKCWFIKLIKSITIAQLLLLYAYIKVQKPIVCG